MPPPGDEDGRLRLGSSKPSRRSAALSSEVLITLVTVTRNDLAGLQRTIWSLTGEDAPWLEHIIIDGLSSDGSAAWVRVNRALQRTIVVSESDHGIYDAMNKGVAIASGSLVVFLNSGDVLAARGALALIRRDYEAGCWRWGFSRTLMLTDTGGRARVLPTPSYNWWRQTYLHYDISHQGVVMERSLLLELGGFDTAYRYAADYKVVTIAGRSYRPYLWRQTMFHTLSGGVSDRRFVEVHHEYHRIRSEATIRKTPIWVDARWTTLLIAKTRLRRVIGHARRLASSTWGQGTR